VATLASRTNAADCIRDADALLERDALSSRQRCRLHIARARALNLIERQSEAHRDLTIAQRLATQLDDHGLAHAIDYALAVAHRAQSDLEAATTYLQRALATSELTKDVAATAIVHNMLAVLAADGGRLKAAYEHADRAIELGRMAGPISYMAHYLNTKAECAA